MKRIPCPGTKSRLPQTGARPSAIPNAKPTTRPSTKSGARPSLLKAPSTSRFSSQSKLAKSKSATSASTEASKIGASACKPSALKKPKESVLKRFDRSVNEELKRRADPANVLVEATTNDANLLEAVDHLARAEAMHSFAGTVRAAEQAASEVSPEFAEEAACAGARNFQAELVDVIHDEVPGLKPIQVIGYIGITRPKKAAR